MKAVRHHSYGDASVLIYEEAARPSPGAGEVLVRVAATSFNSVDTAIRSGYMQQVFPLQFPHVPGLDVSGTVEETGAEVSHLHAGDRVIGFLPMGGNGAAAEFALAPADVLTAAPRSIPLAQAAALPTVGLSAWQALFEHAGLASGQRVLINGAGGAVGAYAIQLAHRVGAFVIATATPRSADAVRRHGADEVVDRTTVSVTDAVTEPVDVVLNLAPMPEPAALLGVVKRGGVFVTTVPPAPEPEPVNGDVRSVALFVRSDRKQLAALVEQVDAGQLTVDVGSMVPLSELAEVHMSSESGELRGKVLLTP
jgi:NADPH:quinone reductase-like Zn-dependent oxidoreductase